MITYIQQEEVALNRRRNKVDMEKVFATVISLAIMVALVVGVVSILRRNNSEGDNKQNYIDLNQINEALNETEQNTQKQTESREAQTNVARNDEKIVRTTKRISKNLRQKAMTVPSHLRKKVLKLESAMWRKIQMKKDKRTQRM